MASNRKDQMDKQLYWDTVNSIQRVMVPLTVGCITLAYHYAPIPLPENDEGITKLLYALKWQLLPALALVIACSLNLHSRTLHQSMDYGLEYQPKPDAIDRVIKTNERISTNTMEQVVISCSGSMILSTFLTQSQMKIIPIIAINAFISRLLFMWGYHQTPNTKRSLGLGPLMITNFATYAVNIYLFVNSLRN